MKYFGILVSLCCLMSSGALSAPGRLAFCCDALSRICCPLSGSTIVVKTEVNADVRHQVIHENSQHSSQQHLAPGHPQNNVFLAEGQEAISNRQEFFRIPMAGESPDTFVGRRLLHPDSGDSPETRNSLSVRNYSGRLAQHLHASQQVIKEEYPSFFYDSGESLPSIACSECCMPINPEICWGCEIKLDDSSRKFFCHLDCIYKLVGGDILRKSIQNKNMQSCTLTLIIRVNHGELSLPKELLDPSVRTYCISKKGRIAIANVLMSLHQSLKGHLYDRKHAISMHCLQIWHLEDRVQSTLDLLDKKGSLMKRIFYM